MIPIYNSNVERYTTSAIAALKSGWVSNHGEWVEKSTRLLQEILGVKHVILMNNGTAATHCLFLALKFRYPQISKIYVPNNVYVAAWNMCLTVYTPQEMTVMKMDTDTWNMATDEDYILSLERNAAVLIVHNLGNIINVPRLKRIRPDLVFIEDNCEGFTGRYENMYSGTASLCSAVSFYGNKIITTGEGGAFVTNDDIVYERIKQVYSQGMSTVQRYVHQVLAYNYRMTNVQAALLYEQLVDIDAILDRKARLFQRYRTLLTPLIELGKISVMKCEAETVPANWMYAIRIRGNVKNLESTFKSAGIDIRPFFYPIHAHAHLREFENDDNVALELNREIIMIPCSPTITPTEQIQVVTTIYACILEQQGLTSAPLEHLKAFIEKIDTTFFTYWVKRTPEETLKNHIATVLLRNTVEEIIAYGHIDRGEDGTVWLGIYLDAAVRGRKIGALLLAYLLHLCYVHAVTEINLSVRKDNTVAKNLYLKFGFMVIQVVGDNIFMRRALML